MGKSWEHNVVLGEMVNGKSSGRLGYTSLSSDMASLDMTKKNALKENNHRLMGICQLAVLAAMLEYQGL